MKTNMINALLRGCELENLANALSLLEEEVQIQLFSIAVGDIPFYTNKTLPKPHFTMLSDYLISTNGEKLIKIVSIEIKGLCESVRICGIQSGEKSSFYKVFSMTTYLSLCDGTYEVEKDSGSTEFDF